MFCPFCGNNNPDTVKFCGKCGGDLQPYLQSSPTPSQPSPVRPTVSAPVKPVAAYPAAPAKPVRVRKPIDRQAVTRVSLQLLLSVLYIGMPVLLLLCAHGFGTVQVDGVAFEEMTVPEFWGFLSEGNYLFSPTSLSLGLSIANRVLLYATPAFALVAVVGTFSKQKHTVPHISYLIVASVSAAVLTLTPLLCLWFVPQFKQAASQQFFVLAEGIETIVLSQQWLLAAVTAVWVIVTSVVTSLANKRKV